MRRLTDLRVAQDVSRCDDAHALTQGAATLLSILTHLTAAGQTAATTCHSHAKQCPAFSHSLPSCLVDAPSCLSSHSRPRQAPVFLVTPRPPHKQSSPHTPHHVTVKMPTFSVVVPSYLIDLSAGKKSSTQLQTDMSGFSLMKEPGPWLLQQARVDLW